MHGPKEHFCEICSKGFVRFGDLRRHKTMHFNVKPFKCPQDGCDQYFKKKNYANIHYKTIHLGLSRYNCIVCNDGFYDSKGRREHMKLYHPVEFLEHDKKVQSKRYERN